MPCDVVYQRKTRDLDELGLNYAFFRIVKKAVYKADGRNRGFISATLAPLDQRSQRTFGAAQAIIVVGLIVGLVGLMRFLLAH